MANLSALNRIRMARSWDEKNVLLQGFENDYRRASSGTRRKWRRAVGDEPERTYAVEVPAIPASVFVPPALPKPTLWQRILKALRLR